MLCKEFVDSSNKDFKSDQAHMKPKYHLYELDSLFLQ